MISFETKQIIDFIEDLRDQSFEFDLLVVTLESGNFSFVYGDDIDQTLMNNYGTCDNCEIVWKITKLFGHIEFSNQDDAAYFRLKYS